MGWIDLRRAEGHVCDKPVIEQDMSAGSTWQCDDCTVIWEITEYGQHVIDIFSGAGRQRPPLLVWRMFPIYRTAENFKW